MVFELRYGFGLLPHNSWHHHLGAVHAQHRGGGASYCVAATRIRSATQRPLVVDGWRCGFSLIEQPMTDLSFVVCVNNQDTLRRCLLASPCIARGDCALTQFEGCSSAAEAFNAALQTARSTWLVFVHQDVLLPQGWDQQFLQGIKIAQQQFKELAVVGVYGVQHHPNGIAHQAIHVGPHESPDARCRWDDVAPHTHPPLQVL